MASELGFLGRNAPIDVEKLHGFGRIGPAPRTVFFFFSKKKFLKEIWPVKVWGAHTPHTSHDTPYSTPHHSPIDQPRAHPGLFLNMPRRGRPPGLKKKPGSFQTRAAGRFGGKKANPPAPLAADTPPHDNDTCYTRSHSATPVRTL